MSIFRYENYRNETNRHTKLTIVAFFHSIFTQICNMKIDISHGPSKIATNKQYKDSN